MTKKSIQSENIRYYGKQYAFYRFLLITFFIISNTSFLILAEESTGNKNINNKKTFLTTNDESKNINCKPCIPASQTWSEPYNINIPLCKEFGCANKCKAELMILRSLSIPTFLFLGFFSYGLYEADSFFGAILAGFLGGFGGLCLGIPVGLVTGYNQGKSYESREETDVNTTFNRPRIGISHSPTFGFFKTERTLFFRFFNREFLKPDIVSVGACLQDYKTRCAPVKKVFADAHWRMTNWRFFNFSFGARSGYAWGSNRFCHAGNLNHEKYKISIPFLELFHRMTLNFVDVFYVSFEPSFELLGPYVQIKKYSDLFLYKQNFRAAINIGLFIF